jgi:hypothetical protein
MPKPKEIHKPRLRIDEKVVKAAYGRVSQHFPTAQYLAMKEGGQLTLAEYLAQISTTQPELLVPHPLKLQAPLTEQEQLIPPLIADILIWSAYIGQIVDEGNRQRHPRGFGD